MVSKKTMAGLLKRETANKFVSPAMKKKIAYILLAILIIIQFFRPAKNINSLSDATANDITKLYMQCLKCAKHFKNQLLRLS